MRLFLGARGQADDLAHQEGRRGHVRVRGHQHGGRARQRPRRVGGVRATRAGAQTGQPGGHGG